MSYKGGIISIEGVDAVGKRTQTTLLEAWLNKNGIVTTVFSFPDYETEIGMEIKAFLSGKRNFLPELRHMLFAANRWEKVPEIRECQKLNETIIINRYSESNIVYGVANGLDFNWLRALEEGVPKSNLVLVLDAPADNLLSRRPGVMDTYEKDGELQLRAQRIYREMAPKLGWVLIDANGEIETVHRRITEMVEKTVLKRSNSHQ